jgi:hypothetical protein
MMRLYQMNKFMKDHVIHESNRQLKQLPMERDRTATTARPPPVRKVSNSYPGGGGVNPGREHAHPRLNPSEALTPIPGGKVLFSIGPDVTPEQESTSIEPQLHVQLIDKTKLVNPAQVAETFTRDKVRPGIAQGFFLFEGQFTVDP